MKILNTPEERCNELQELAKVYNKRNTQVLYSTQAMHYFNQTLNPKINQLMEEAQCDKLIAYFVEASKRKFLETKQTLQQNDLDEVFKEVYGGLDELTQKLNNNYK